MNAGDTGWNESYTITIMQLCRKRFDLPVYKDCFDISSRYF